MLFRVIIAILTITIGAMTAYAVAPANSLITNTASMTYTGLTAPITASVDVKVSLVTAAPNLILLSNNVTIAENQTGILSYTITATANGPDTYAINNPSNVATNVTTNGASVPSIVSVILGASAVSVTALQGTNVITVPSDGVTDGEVNGITAGDTLEILGQTYVVATIVDNATGNSTITLTSKLLAPLPLGTLVAEQAVFTVNQSVGQVAVGVAQGSNAISITASSSNGQITAITTGTITVLRIAFEKWVSVNGAAFTRTMPTVASGDTLTYRLLTNVPVATTINGVGFSDAIPLFTTYVINSTTMDTDGPNAATVISAAVADVAGTTPLAQVGGLLINSTGQATGTIAATAAAVAEVSVEFQVTVD